MFGTPQWSTPWNCIQRWHSEEGIHLAKMGCGEVNVHFHSRSSTDTTIKPVLFLLIVHIIAIAPSPSQFVKPFQKSHLHVQLNATHDPHSITAITPHSTPFCFLHTAITQPTRYTSFWIQNRHFDGEAAVENDWLNAFSFLAFQNTLNWSLIHNRHDLEEPDRCVLDQFRGA